MRKSKRPEREGRNKERTWSQEAGICFALLKMLLPKKDKNLSINYWKWGVGKARKRD